MKRHAGFCAIALTFVLLLGSASLPVTGDPARTNEQAVLDDFADALTLVEEHYVNKINYEELTKMAILGMLHSLDPHSHYYDKREFARFRTEQTSQYFGIGATIGARNGKVYILAPFPDTPAYRGGLRYGDQIVAINGESTDGWPSTQVSARLRGPRGTSVEVQVQRAGEKKPRTVKLVRDAVPLPSISSAYILRGQSRAGSPVPSGQRAATSKIELTTDPRPSSRDSRNPAGGIRPGPQASNVSQVVGYINLQRSFNTTTDDELSQTLDRLKEQGMQALILDLRNNPGGILDQAVRVAERFLYQDQLILTQKSRSNKRDATRTYHSRNPQPTLMPLVILVNRATASASEIVSAAIQEHDRGLLVGESTFGKGLVQTILPLPFGAGLTLTTAKYLTPSGRLIQRTYDNLSFYDYYFRRRPDDRGETLSSPIGPSFRTDAGREVYGGGGIKPDKIAPPTQVTETQLRLQGVVFAFARELVAGLIPGLESYRTTSLEFNHVLGENEYRISDAILDAFKKFALAHKQAFRITPPMIESHREFIRGSIRFEVVTAAYGLETAEQVLAETDLQLLEALEAIPEAIRLAEKYKTVSSQ